MRKTAVGRIKSYRVVKRNGIHSAKVSEVVLVRRIVAVPTHDVEARVLLPSVPECAKELVVDNKVALLLLEPSNGRLEVALVSEAVGADRTTVG